MQEFLVTALVFLAGAMLLFAAQRRFGAREQRFIWAAFLAHTLGAFAQVGITRYFYGGGDLLNFYRLGVPIAEWLGANFTANAPLLLRMIFHQDVYMPIHVIGAGGSTGSMFGLAALMIFVLGESLLAICLLLSYAALAGQIAIYAGLRSMIAPRLRQRVILGVLLLPSVVFWTSGLLKETFALAGLGFMFLGVKLLISGRHRLAGLGALIAGYIPVSLVKAYILFPFFIAVAVWFYWHRAQQTRGKVAIVSKPIYMLLGLFGAIGALLLFGELFPKYSINNIANELATVQTMFQENVKGGSTYAIAVPREQSIAAQLSLLPIGLISALFRPFIFEAHNAMALINALETTAIFGAFVWIIIQRGPRTVFKVITSSPVAMFCVVFTLLFGTIVGIATPNLGSLSRYRVPMMPFYVTLLLVLSPSRR